MTTILLWIVIFLEFLQYLIFFDIILSWLSLAGIRFRPKFLSDIIDPLYRGVKKYIPTTFWMFDFTPIIIIIILIFCINLIYMNVPEVFQTIQSLKQR